MKTNLVVVSKSHEMMLYLLPLAVTAWHAVHFPRPVSRENRGLHMCVLPADDAFERDAAMYAANELFNAAQSSADDSQHPTWLYLELGSLIEMVLAPPPGTGVDWMPISGTDEATTTPYILLNDEKVSAEECYRRAMTSSPDCGEAHKRLADVLVAMGKIQEAQTYFKSASKLLPRDICCATHSWYGDPPIGSQRTAVPLPGDESSSDDSPPVDLMSLTTQHTTEEDLKAAACVFEQHGVCVLDSVLNAAEIATLMTAIDEAIEGGEDVGSVDLIDETRNADSRDHRALPIRNSVQDVLSDTLAKLSPLLCRILQAEEMPLIGAGFMCVHPGAEAQDLHKDVHGHDRHELTDTVGLGGPRAVSIQLQLTDTTAEGPERAAMGSLLVLPGSHRPDARCGTPERIKAAATSSTQDPAVLSVTVPPGSVTIYSSRLWHCGGANRSERHTRRFCFLTLSEPDAPAPPGLIHTMSLDDIGAFVVTRNGLKRVAQ